jgi:APA family basic amino acid/polyamine antiporter
LSRNDEEEHSLRREVGWFGSFSMGYADVGADIYVALGLVALYAAGAAPVAFAIASITYICTAMAYAELSSTYPYAGGAHVYAMKASNDFVGFIAGWAVMLDYTIDISLFSLATAGYIAFFIPGLSSLYIPISVFGFQVTIPYIGLLAFSLVMFLLVINLVGIRESSILNVSLVALDLTVESIVLILGFMFSFNSSTFASQVTSPGANVQYTNLSYFLGQNVKTENFIYGITLAMCSFIGIESIAQATEETKKPYKWAPRAHKLSIVAVIVFALGLSILAIGMVSWQTLAQNQLNPVAMIASHIPTVGVLLAVVVGFTGIAICYASTNTGIIGVSRVVFSMGRYKLLPRWFYKVHPRTKTPYRTIIIFGLIGGSIALVGELQFVADLYNFGALLSYIIVNISVIVLRNRDKEAYRPWKIPLDLKIKVRNRKILLPMVSVIGAISCTIIWSLVVTYHPMGRAFGAIWLIVGIIGFIVYRKHAGLSVFSTTTGKQIQPGGYTMKSLVLVRIPEDENIVLSAIKKNLDKRLLITLCNVVDPEEYGLSLDNIKSYSVLKTLEEESKIALNRMVKKVKGMGYKSRGKVLVGHMKDVLKEEAESDANDLIILLKRRTERAGIEKHMSEAYRIASMYPGKVMIIRRET